VQVPFAYAIVLRSALHGAGDVRAVMVLTWICQWGLRLPLCYLLSGVDLPLPAALGGGVLENPSPVDWGLTGLWIGLCAEIALRSLIYTARFLGGKWMRARV
jgi:Na+-driven multidrug efflux pump